MNFYVLKINEINVMTCNYNLKNDINDNLYDILSELVEKNY